MIRRDAIFLALTATTAMSLVAFDSDAQQSSSDRQTPNPVEIYFEELHQHLRKFRTYPKEALNTLSEGKVIVRLVVARDGQVLEATIDQSSGSYLIDETELETIRRASPVPPLPDAMSGKAVVLKLPIRYSLRGRR
jgi:protein TonB